MKALLELELTDNQLKALKYFNPGYLITLRN